MSEVPLYHRCRFPAVGSNRGLYACAAPFADETHRTRKAKERERERPGSDAKPGLRADSSFCQTA